MKITFILKDGEKKTVNFKEGQTILQSAEENEIPLHGACEGFGVCGGCHVSIENFSELLPPISDKENAGLDKVRGLTMKSRLACQVVLDKNLDGLIVKLY